MNRTFPPPCARVLRATLLGLALGMPGAYASAAASPAPAAAVAPAADATALRPATLVAFNRPIVVFRSAFLGNPPEERARAGAERIDRLLSGAEEHRITTTPLPEGIVVGIDGAFVFMVTPADVDALAGETLETTARKAAAALEQVAAETRESRNLRAMLIALGLSAAATAVFAVLWWVLSRLRRFMEARLLARIRAYADRLRIGDASLFHREDLLRLIHALLTGAYWAALLLLAYEWLGYVFAQFPYTRPWGESLHGFLIGLLGGIGGSMLRALPELAVAVVIFLIARFFVGVLGGFFRRVEAGGVEIGWLNPDTAGPTRRIAIFLVWIFALVMAYPYLPGSNTDAFKGISVLIGLMVSIGASSTIGQAASGLILMYTRTIRPGEYVRVGDHEGTVTEMGMFTTRIRTGLGEELTLPNSLIVGSVTKNYSRAVQGQGFILDTTVTIGYDTPWRQVEAMLFLAARRTAGILEQPAPRVFQTALSDFYPEYRLVCQAVPSEPRPRAEVLNVLHQNIQDVFNENGVQIMSPHYLDDPQQAKLVPKDQWYAAPAQPPAGAR